SALPSIHLLSSSLTPFGAGAVSAKASPARPRSARPSRPEVILRKWGMWVPVLEKSGAGPEARRGPTSQVSGVRSPVLLEEVFYQVLRQPAGDVHDPAAVGNLDRFDHFEQERQFLSLLAQKRQADQRRLEHLVAGLLHAGGGVGVGGGQ